MTETDNRRAHPRGATKRARPAPGTFSIAAIDPETGATGVGVSTALVAVGALCPFVSANAAVATQSFVEVSHGANAVAMADRGVDIPTVCQALLDADPHASYRQLHGIDAGGETFTFTGADCVEWHGSIKGETYTIAGNMLAGEATIEGMREAFEGADGPLSERLLVALEGGQESGGDKRGKISAALLVHAPEPKLYHNLRIDNSDDPVGDLRAAYELAVETEDVLPEMTEEMLGDYPEEIRDFGLKY